MDVPCHKHGSILATEASVSTLARTPRIRHSIESLPLPWDTKWTVALPTDAGVVLWPSFSPKPTLGGIHPPGPFASGALLCPAAEYPTCWPCGAQVLHGGKTKSCPRPSSARLTQSPPTGPPYSRRRRLFWMCTGHVLFCRLGGGHRAATYTARTHST